MGTDYIVVCTECKMKTDSGRNGRFYESCIPFLEKHMHCLPRFFDDEYPSEYIGWPENRDDEERRAEKARLAYEKTDKYKIYQLENAVSYLKEDIKEIRQALRAADFNISKLFALHKSQLQEELEQRLK